MKKLLTIDEAIEIHANLIKEFGGTAGIRDLNALDSALGRLQTGYYENIYEEAAALMESLAINHPFIDGNKRMAFFATDVFLRLNGYYIESKSNQAYNFFMSLFNSSEFHFDNLVVWLKQHINKF
jgi:death-on-curing protein